MLSYQLGHGWYVRSSDATWNFNLRHGTSTTMPLSAGLGKVWNLSGGMAINGSACGRMDDISAICSADRAIHLKVPDDAAVSDVEL